MGFRNYLIEGLPGSGKSMVAQELESRGYHVIHGDRELAYHGDPETGEPEHDPTALTGLASRHHRWIWNLEKVRSLVGDHTHSETFFCGGSRNYQRHIDLFDKVLMLDIDLEALKKRVSGRAENEFGATPDEWAFLVRLHATREGMPESALRIDADRPVSLIVDEILTICRDGSY